VIVNPLSGFGQIKRQLKIRIQEHASDIRKKNGPPSVIYSYRLKYNHEFNWTDVQILDHEHNYNKRLISKMIYILKQK